MKRVLLIVISIIFLITSASCRFNSEDSILRYDIGAEPKTLDPQAANDDAAMMILSHVMEGLLTKNLQGEIVEGCAESYTISDDGLTYTFTLRDGLQWSDGSDLTSDDFLFAFTRIFLPETQAFDISRYMCIKNAKQIYAGELSINELGVTAPDERTLVISLDYKDSSFLQTLTSVSSYPCNRAFFEKTKGKYGADYKNVIFNNRFVISTWKNDNYITLRPNYKYYNQSAIKSGGINFYTSSDIDYETRFFEEATEIVSLPADKIKNLNTDKFKTLEFSCTTWVMGFNQNNEIFKNQNLRMALALCANNIDVVPDANVFSIAKRISPPAFNEEYDVTALSSEQSAFSFYSAALKELKLKKLPTISVVCPDFYDFKLYLTYLQKFWMQELGLAINFEVLDIDDFNKTLDNGNFDIILFPLVASGDSSLDILNSFNSLASNNYLNYRNDEFDNLLTLITQQTDEENTNSLLSKAESQLIETAVIFPVYHEKQYLVYNKRVKDISISTFGYNINFNFAYKE